MTDPKIEELTRRIDAAQRQNRRWQWTVTVTLAVTAGAVILNQTFPVKLGKVIEAERFVLRDARGGYRAELGFMDGASFLLLNDRDGKPGAALSVLPDGPRRLSLFDREGRARSVLTAQVDGDSGLQLFDRNLIHRASLDVSADGKPALRLADKEKKQEKDPAENMVLSGLTANSRVSRPVESSVCSWPWQQAARSGGLVPATGDRTTLN